MLCHRRCFDSIDFSGSSLDCKEGQDARPGSHIKDNLILEVREIGNDGPLISRGSDVVLHHVLLLGEIPIELKVLSG